MIRNKRQCHFKGNFMVICPAIIVCSPTFKCMFTSKNQIFSLIENNNIIMEFAPNFKSLKKHRYTESCRVKLRFQRYYMDRYMTYIRDRTCISG